jgi:hypothetical protein
VAGLNIVVRGWTEDARADALTLQERLGGIADAAPAGTMLADRMSEVLSAMEVVVEHLDAILAP